MSWSPEQLLEFASADDTRVAPFRPDGETPGTPTFIWSVVADGHLYIRPYSGPSSRWYKAAMEQRAGQLKLSGRFHDVRFVPAPDDVTDAVDAAYRKKYATSRYLAPMISGHVRSSTVEVLPRD